jgi:hypothetical protein
MIQQVDDIGVKEANVLGVSYEEYASSVGQQSPESHRGDTANSARNQFKHEHTTPGLPTHPQYPTPQKITASSCFRKSKFAAFIKVVHLIGQYFGIEKSSHLTRRSA